MNPRYYQYFEEIAAIHEDNTSMLDKCTRLRTCLEDVSKVLSRDDGIVFPNLYARLDYVCNKMQIPEEMKRNLHNFRIRINKFVHEGQSVEMAEYYGFVKLLAEGFAALFQGQIPPELAPIYQHNDSAVAEVYDDTSVADAIRGLVREHDRERMIFKLSPENGNPQDLLKIKYGVKDKNYELIPSMEFLQKGDLVQLLGIFTDEEGALIPDLIVIQPDYLVDVTAVAGCFMKIKGVKVKAAELFFTGRAQKREITPAIHKGNVANLFFDEVLNEKPSEKTSYDEVLKKSFQEYPLAYTAVKGKPKAEKLPEDLKIQYRNIREVVDNAFRRGDYQPIDRDRSNLEVFLISHELGIQGRMDLFDATPSANQRYQSKIIELKSGNPPYPQQDPHQVDESHAIQVRMYNMLTSRVLGYDSDKIYQAVMYSAVTRPGEAIRYVKQDKRWEGEIINVRNVIVAQEFRLAHDNERFEAGKALVEGIDPGKHGLDGNVFPWVLKKFTLFPEILEKASALEREYFFAFSSFIAREKLLSKIGDGEHSKGLSALWNKEELTDEDAFNQLKALEIRDNRADQPGALIFMRRAVDSNRFVNFRRGDICVLYPDIDDRPLAVQHRVLKCTIESISNEEVVLKLRQQQSSLEYFNDHEKWAVEHDSLDNNFEQMYRGLFEFLKLEKAKRDLLLGLQAPGEYEYDEKVFVTEKNSFSPADSRKEQNELLSKAWHSPDYFLLVGPPGTGKTNNFLHNIVKHLVEETSLNILLVSYTNRAVDEMCSSVREILNDELIRIGSALGCDATHQDLMLDAKISGLGDRKEIRNLIQNTRVYTGTLSSILGRNELFDLKKFDIAIVDEASQILEPNIIHLLGRVDKFVLIGDERQLPAVVTQSVGQSALDHKELNEIGLYDRRNSYFERLLYLCKKNKWHHAWGELTFQGRMHPAIATFPNQCFYHNKLKEVGLLHQTDEITASGEVSTDFEQLLTMHRMVYIPSEPAIRAVSAKSNQQEAEVISKTLQTLAKIHQMDDAAIVEKIGIITPYRNQIACIRQQLEKDGIDCFDDVQVDTVERYQGSQKDFILISLCLGTPAQMEFMAAARVIIDDKDGFMPTLIDRKLNVTLTRAKRQIVITGEEGVLSGDATYSKLVEHIRISGGYVRGGAAGILDGTFVLSDLPKKATDRNHEKMPSSFSTAWQTIIGTPVFEHPATQGGQILGYPSDINLNIGTEYGRADFDQKSGMFLWNDNENFLSPTEKVLLYGHFHLRTNYLATLNLTNRFKSPLLTLAGNAGGRVTIIDFGAGPATAGMALTDALDSHLETGSFNYLGVESSEHMRQMASAFLEFDSYRRRPYYKLLSGPEELSETLLSPAFENPGLVIFTFSYILEQITVEEVMRFTEVMKVIRTNYPQNSYCTLVVAAPGARNSYNIRQFRKLTGAVNQNNDDVFEFSYPAKKDGSKLKTVRYFGEFFV